VTSKPLARETGGAGVLGSHLCERLLSVGYRVTRTGNLRTGSSDNAAHLKDEGDSGYIDHHVTIYIRASPGSWTRSILRLAREVYSEPLVRPRREESRRNVREVLAKR
jgi:nucleoside-diphosphate-sugar epimerase